MQQHVRTYKIDELGRILLPKKIRELLDWSIGDSLVLSYVNRNTAILQSIKEGTICTFCGEAEMYVNIIGKNICLECIGRIGAFDTKGA